MRRRTPLRVDHAKARAWQRRSRKELPRHKALPAVNRRRRRKLRAAQYGEHAARIVRRPCVVCRPGEQTTPTVPAHAVKTRGAGADMTTLTPLCVRHEHEWHTAGRWTFRDRYNVDLEAVAARLWDEL